MSDRFLKADKDKPRYSLIPHEALDAVAKVMTFGAKKYADHNWRNANSWSRYYDAALRHLTAWNRGEDDDLETGMNHLDHAACCVLMLSSLVKSNLGSDDRWIPNAERVRYPVDDVELCGELHPSLGVKCIKSGGHKGPHRESDVIVWPRLTE